MKNDGELLNEFISSGKEASFEELVRRHGGMVLAVCRSTIGNEHDAEDAAQAVFLTLAGKAKTLCRRQSIGGWLHHVARYVSLRARESEGLRKIRQEEAKSMIESISHRNSLQNAPEKEELKQLIDTELDALPEKYRLPIILHHLEGRTIEEVARHLGLNAGTVSAQLSRGKLILQKRLTRQGVALSGLMLGALLSENVSATVSDTFISLTTKAATVVVAGNLAAGGVISSKVALLTKGTMKAMFIEKLKVITIASIVFIGVSTAIGVSTYQFLLGRETVAQDQNVSQVQTHVEGKNTSTKPVSVVKETSVPVKQETVTSQGDNIQDKPNVQDATDKPLTRVEVRHNIICAHNMRQIALACKQYALDNDKIPNSFSDLFSGNYLAPSEIFLCPADPNPVTVITAENVDRESSYMFFSKNLKDSDDSDTPLIIEKKNQHVSHHGEAGKGGNIAFIGGQCIFVADADKYLKEYREKRKKAGSE